MTPSHYTNSQKSNNFIWVCWFLGKNVSNFVSLDLKLHNQYCNILDTYCIELKTTDFAHCAKYNFFSMQNIAALLQCNCNTHTESNLKNLIWKLLRKTRVVQRGYLYSRSHATLIKLNLPMRIQALWVGQHS